MRLIAPLLFCMIGAAAGVVVALAFGGRGTGPRLGAAFGLAGGFAGLLLRDALDLDGLDVLGGALLAVALGGALAALLANLLARARSGPAGGRRRP